MWISKFKKQDDFGTSKELQEEFDTQDQNEVNHSTLFHLVLSSKIKICVKKLNRKFLEKILIIIAMRFRSRKF